MSHLETPATPYRVQVLDRTISILDALAERGDGSLLELAETVQLHKSTAHRLLMILERHRMVERDEHTGRFHLGLRLFELGTVAIGRLNVRERARRYLERLVYELEETAHLCVLDSGEVLYVDKIEPSRSVRMASRVGRTNPAHCTAVGKAMLSHLSEREVDEILRRHGMKRATPSTITTPAALKAELKAVRDRGYAIDDEEAEEGVRCVGAAVLGHNGRPMAAISISAPAFRLPMDKVPVVAASVCRAARAISEEYGFHI